MVSQAVENGENSSERLLSMVYDEWRKLAYARMANKRAGHTLQATALVHGTSGCAGPAGVRARRQKVGGVEKPEG